MHSVRSYQDIKSTDELEKEAEEYVKQNYCDMCVMADDCKCGCIDCFTVQSYLASAEPREKRIAELEAQIEKMKCGQNCKHSYLYQEDRKCKFTYCDCINCKDKWELRR